MTTLQDLIDLAKERNLNPSDCVLFLGEECANGDIQHDYLYKLRVVESVDTLSHEDKWEVVPIGFVMEILPW